MSKISKECISYIISVKEIIYESFVIQLKAGNAIFLMFQKFADSVLSSYNAINLNLIDQFSCRKS